MEESNVELMDLESSNEQLHTVIQEKEDIINQKNTEIDNLNKQIDWYESIIESYINLSKLVR